MGYRSDVYLALSPTNFDNMVKKLDDLLIANLLDGTDHYRSKCGWHLLHWNSVKWYPEFSEVKAVEDFITEIESSEDENVSEGFSYHILGEDQDDYTQRGSWNNPFELRLERQVNFEFDSVEEKPVE